MFVIKNLDTGTQMRIDDFDRLTHIAADPDPASQVRKQLWRAVRQPIAPFNKHVRSVQVSDSVLSSTWQCADRKLLVLQEAHPAHKKGGLMKGTKALKHWYAAGPHAGMQQAQQQVGGVCWGLHSPVST